MRHSNRKNQHGFTLLELLIAISILAILLSLAIPSFVEFLKNNRVSAQTNEMVSLINLAKSQAVRRHAALDGGDFEVVLEITSTDNGWTAIVCETGSGGQCDDLDAEVIRNVDNRRVLLKPNVEVITFDSRGYLRKGWGDLEIYLEHSNCSGANQHRMLEILPSGRIEIKRLNCNGNEIT